MKIFLSGVCDRAQDPLYEVHFLEAHQEMELMGFEVMDHTEIDWGETDWMTQLLSRLVILETCDAIYLIGHRGEWSRSPDAYIEYLCARQLQLDIFSQKDKPRRTDDESE